MLKFFPRLATKGEGVADSMYWDSYVQVAGSDFTTTSTSLVDITGLTYAAAINSLYEIEACLKVQNTQGAGSEFAITCSAAGATGEFIIMASRAQTSSNIGLDAQAIGNANTNGVVTTINLDGIVFIKAVVTTVGATGNITVQAQKATSGTATIYIGSVMKIKKLA